MKIHGWVILGLFAAATGCGSMRPAPQAAAPATAPAARVFDPAQLLTLDEIEPKLTLPKAQPATQPAPLEAITLYAEARDLLLQNQRYRAINLLSQALRLDPESFELNYALGRAYAGAGGMNDSAIRAFERAAEINPNHLEVQTELGRAYQSKNEFATAVERLRLAQMTDGYKDGEPLAAVVDFRLGVLLKEQGNTTAALQCFTRLQDRLEHPNGAIRSTPEAIYLLSRPEIVYEEVGRLHEALGNLPQALAAYQQVAGTSPDEFAPQARLVRLLVQMNRGNDALATAAELVRSSRASVESIALLREIHEKTGGRSSFVDELRRLHRQHPEDRALLFALADTLAGSGQLAQAAELLNRDIDARGGDVEIVQRLYHLYADRDQVDDAARVIFRAMTAHPHLTMELEPLIGELTRFSRRNALRLATLTKLNVPAASEPARQYFIAQMASPERPTVSRNALDLAAKATPVFDPACRLQMADILTRPDFTDERRQQAAQALVQSVRTRGREDLAEELLGQVAVAAQQLDSAVGHFAEAVRLAPPTGPAPELLITYASVVREQGNIPRFEQMMWKLVDDRPRCTQAYRLLLSHYDRANAESQAWNVRNTWIAADPQNVHARLSLIAGLIQLRRGDEAIAQMRRLFDDNPDDPIVIDNMMTLFGSINQERQLIDLFEAERFRHPNNRVITEYLVKLYAEQRRVADAARVIEAAQASVANDADLLYYVANLYHRIDQPQKTQDVLQDVLKVNPNHPQAANDLGYTWADEGKNLEQAESLIRIAVAADPENPSYLDSLGWVLYKRSKFEEAAKLLQQASEPLESADPIVLDHLGDALYRTGKSAEAVATWQNAQGRLQIELADQPQRSDLQRLSLQLQAKLQQGLAGQPVNVAPIVESSPNSQQTSSTGQNNGRP